MKTIVHLLKPKEYRVWCLPNRPVGNLATTNKPSKCTCGNCLTIMRGATQGRHSQFLVHWTRRNLDETKHH